jgi:hypothetical protein
MAIQPTAVLPEKVINFVEASSALAEKAAADERARQATEKRAEALIPGIVDLLGPSPCSKRTRRWPVPTRSGTTPAP